MIKFITLLCLVIVIPFIISCSNKHISFNTEKKINPYDVGSDDPVDIKDVIEVIVDNPEIEDPEVEPEPEIEDPTPLFKAYTETFYQKMISKVDILFVVDNSPSMKTEQAKMADRFENFIENLSDVDWQIGITTTDVSDGPYGVKGSLLPFYQSHLKMIDSSVSNAEFLFRNTVKRRETGSATEEPLKAVIRALKKQNTDNFGFFRQGADLAIVILTDEDEKSDGSNNATKSQQVVDQIQLIWQGAKRTSVYGIIVEPDDNKCLKEQKKQCENGGVLTSILNKCGNYGEHVSRLARHSFMESGFTGSICEKEYGAMLSGIGETVGTIARSIELKRDPIVDSVQIEFIPFENQVNYWVQGRRVYFVKTPAKDTEIRIKYNSQK